MQDSLESPCWPIAGTMPASGADASSVPSRALRCLELAVTAARNYAILVARADQLVLSIQRMDFRLTAAEEARMQAQITDNAMQLRAAEQLLTRVFEDLDASENEVLAEISGMATTEVHASVERH